MSNYSDFYPQDEGGTDLVPGIVQNTSSGNIADGINYLDISDGIIVDQSLYPNLDTNLLVSDWANAILEQEINNPTPLASEYFGTYVALHEDTAVISATHTDTGALESGTVYIYKRTGTTWALEQTIVNPDPDASDWFGSSLAIYGDTIAIGLDKKLGLSSTGGLYIYKRSGTTWTLEDTITDPVPDIDGNHGFSDRVSIFEDTLVTGSHLDDTGASTAGSVYVFTRTAGVWTLEDTIINPTPLLGDQFGWAVDIYLDTIVIGSNLDNSPTTSAGAAFVYNRTGTTWTLTQYIPHPEQEVSAEFGTSVGIYGDTIVVGAIDDDAGAGSMYVFRLSSGTWTLEQKISNHSTDTSDLFGQSVDIYGDVLITGGKWRDVGALSAAGSIYVYTRTGTTWTVQKELTVPVPTASDQFAGTVAIHKNTILSGAILEDTGASAAGSAYIFTPADKGTFSIQAQDKVLKITN